MPLSGVTGWLPDPGDGRDSPGSRLGVRGHRPAPLAQAAVTRRVRQYSLPMNQDRDPTGRFRVPGRTCPECGSARWQQTAITYHNTTPQWSARRQCKACGKQWEAAWDDDTPSVGSEGGR